ncbi:MAG: DNA methyltransferase [Chloroflexota bacterium]|nr:DNA methyltransferase [Chloroflexota bacterium]
MELRPDSKVHYLAEDGVLICGDARHLLEVPDSSVDLVATDPPFNIGLDYGTGLSDRLSDEQYGQFTQEWLNQAMRVLKPGGQLVAIMPDKLQRVWRPLVPRDARVLVWLKTFGPHLHMGPSYLAAWEPIVWIVRGKRPNTFNRWKSFYSDIDWIVGPNGASESRAVPEMRAHPAPRPSWLFEEIITRATRPGDVVLDPMMGSGTTPAVARRLGRRFIGYDLNPEYVTRAADRVRRAVLDPLRLDRASNSALAFRECLAWALANQRKFLPWAQRHPEVAWGKIQEDSIAIRKNELRKRLIVCGYSVDLVLRQWADEGLLVRHKGELTHVVRFGRVIDRAYVIVL